MVDATLTAEERRDLGDMAVLVLDQAVAIDQLHAYAAREHALFVAERDLRLEAREYLVRTLAALRAALLLLRSYGCPGLPTSPHLTPEALESVITEMEAQ